MTDNYKVKEEFNPTCEIRRMEIGLYKIFSFKNFGFEAEIFKM